MDESHPGHHGEIGPDCPVACLLTVMSRKAWLPLTRARGPVGAPPETVGDVLKMHARSQFRDIWGLGPRRTGEIETALIFAGFDLTASQHSAGSRVQSRPAEGKPEA